MSFPSRPPKIGLIQPINSKRYRRIALFPIEVKFGTMIDFANHWLSFRIITRMYDLFEIF